MPRGRRPVLTPEQRELLLNQLAAGVSLRASAETAGLGSRTLDRYLARGTDAQRVIDTYLDTLTPTRQAVIDRWDPEKRLTHLEQQIPEGERFYWRFWREATRARARAETLAVARIREAGAGYQQTETVVEVREVLQRQADGSQEVVSLTTTRTITRDQRDWRAEAFILQNGFARDDWFRKPGRVELTGAEGGPPVAFTGVEAAQAAAMRAVSEFEERRQKQIEAEEDAGAPGDVERAGDG